jgi:hypothetical protein
MANFQIIESNFAVAEDGTIDKVIQVKRGGFWERMFDPDPTLPLWQKTKTKVVKVANFKPVMYLLKEMNQLICHPSLVGEIRKAMDSQSRSDFYRW